MGSLAGKTMVEKLTEKQGIQFYRLKSDKFNTTRVDIFFVDDLEKERASGNAILPSILKRGCGKYPSITELERKLEELYGADVGGGTLKKGEAHLIGFRMSHISDRYTFNNTRLFDECCNLLMCILESPLTEDNGFKKSVFTKERDNLINYIRSRINNKIHFSLYRCIEEMCHGEPFAIPEEGTEEDALLLTPQNTFAQYKEMIQSYPAYVYISGEVDDTSIQNFIDNFLKAGRGDIKSIKTPDVKKEISEVKRVEEGMEVNQGKLCLGFRTQIDPCSPDYYPLVVYNGILGGDTHSKLFQNVREKASLAYYAQSVLEKYKGLMIVMSGIEAENRQKAEEIILKQVEDMRKGNITKDEIDATKKSLETGMKAMQDSQGAIVDFFLSQHLTNCADDFESTAEKFRQVTIDDVVRVAQNIQLDAVYFLKPKNFKEGIA
ncbi:MAG: insulinase family protein [Clostridiaceae bacterium]|nr:insulinase family protein [Clostridiaceae bacterium]